MPVEEIVRSFATDLIGDRLRLQQPDGRLGKTLKQLVAEALQERGAARPVLTHGVPDANGVRAPHWADWMAGILLTAALVTKLYYRIKSLSTDAPRRPDHNDEAILTGESLSWGILNADYLQPCRKILRDLRPRVVEITRGLGPPDGERDKLMVDTVGKLLERVDNGLTTEEVRIELADLHALAEFAWFCLTTVTTEPVYPGWSDLLLDLSNYDSPIPIGGRIGTPLFQSMTEAQGFIKNWYQEVTRKSWARRVEGEGTEDESLYGAAAELLNAQYRYRETCGKTREKGGQTATPPLTTAFVTSFDLELELSLLRLGKPFTVVLPVHLLNQKHSIAHTCWIALDIRGENDGESYDRLSDLMQAEEGSYRIVDKQKCGKAGPVVVRLAGCPLIKLPDLSVDSPLKLDLIKVFGNYLRAEAGPAEKAYENLVKDQLQLQHAVVINEHDAILQSEIDLISIPQGELSYGLPAQFAAGNRHASRFWMMLGVQIHDSAVRNRVVTLISSLPHMVSASPRPAQNSTTPPPEADWEESGSRVEAARNAECRGVAVNKYSTELEQDLLFWNGFHVVRDDVSEFAKDLRHCTVHLEQGAIFQSSGVCNVN